MLALQQGVGMAKSTVLSVRIDKELHRSLKVLAAQDGVSLGSVVTRALEALLTKKEPR